MSRCKQVELTERIQFPMNRWMNRFGLDDCDERSPLLFTFPAVTIHQNHAQEIDMQNMTWHTPVLVDSNGFRNGRAVNGHVGWCRFGSAASLALKVHQRVLNLECVLSQADECEVLSTHSCTP